MTSVSYESSLSKEIITLYDLYPNNAIKKRNQIYWNACFRGGNCVRMDMGMHVFRGGNCVRMDMGKVLSNKIITVTDTCAVRVNTFCWCNTV